MLLSANIISFVFVPSHLFLAQLPRVGQDSRNFLLFISSQTLPSGRLLGLDFFGYVGAVQKEQENSPVKSPVNACLGLALALVRA